MGLLQDPKKSLAQVRWYLEHQELERFPGAFELAAGNLCRQTLEQMLFILCFFSGMRTERYMRPDRTLRTAGSLIKALEKLDSDTGLTYLKIASRKGPRIAKFAKTIRSLKMWQRELNEPSHFSTRLRRIDTTWLSTFLTRADDLLDDRDGPLIVAALNEVFSKGRMRAILYNDTPGLLFKAVITPKHIVATEQGDLVLRSPSQGFEVISDSAIPRGRWPRRPVFVETPVGFTLATQYFTKRGEPIDGSSLESLLLSLAKTKGQQSAMTRRLRQLGFNVEWPRPKPTGTV